MTPREVEQELDKLEPALVAAYLEQIATTVEQTPLSQAERTLGGPIAAAIEAGAFVAFLEVLRAGYLRGQRREISGLPRRYVLLVGLEANPNSRRTAAWLTRLTEDFLGQARTAQADAVRETIAAGIGQGRSRRQIALDLIGRQQPTGRRRGGVVGLSGEEARAVANARAQLASGDLAQLKAYLRRGLRERALDGRVKRALDGEKLRPAEIDRIAGEYSARLLRARAELIARTRSLEAFGAARENLYLDLSDAGYRVTKAWKTRRDDDVRDSHEAMDGQKVEARQPFRSGYGSLMQYPGDASLGAPLRDRAGCRCAAVYRVRFT